MVKFKSNIPYTHKKNEGNTATQTVTALALSSPIQKDRQQQQQRRNHSQKDDGQLSYQRIVTTMGSRSAFLLLVAAGPLPLLCMNNRERDSFQIQGKVGRNWSADFSWLVERRLPHNQMADGFIFTSPWVSFSACLQKAKTWAQQVVKHTVQQ